MYCPDCEMHVQTDPSWSSEWTKRDEYFFTNYSDIECEGEYDRQQIGEVIVKDGKGGPSEYVWIIATIVVKFSICERTRSDFGSLFAFPSLKALVNIDPDERRLWKLVLDNHSDTPGEKIRINPLAQQIGMNPQRARQLVRTWNNRGWVDFAVSAEQFYVVEDVSIDSMK